MLPSDHHAAGNLGTTGNAEHRDSGIPTSSTTPVYFLGDYVHDCPMRRLWTPPILMPSILRRYRVQITASTVLQTSPDTSMCTIPPRHEHVIANRAAGRRYHSCCVRRNVAFGRRGRQAIQSGEKYLARSSSIPLYAVSRCRFGCRFAKISPYGSGAVMALPESCSSTAWPQKGT